MTVAHCCLVRNSPGELFSVMPGTEMFLQIESSMISQTRLAEIISMHLGIPFGVTSRQSDSGLSNGEPSPSGTVRDFQQPPAAQQSSWPMVCR